MTVLQGRLPSDLSHALNLGLLASCFNLVFDTSSQFTPKLDFMYRLERMLSINGTLRKASLILDFTGAHISGYFRVYLEIHQK